MARHSNHLSWKSSRRAYCRNDTLQCVCESRETTLDPGSPWRKDIRSISHQTAVGERTVETIRYNVCVELEKQLLTESTLPRESRLPATFRSTRPSEHGNHRGSATLAPLHARSLETRFDGVCACERHRPPITILRTLFANCKIHPFRTSVS